MKKQMKRFLSVTLLLITFASGIVSQVYFPDNFRITDYISDIMPLADDGLPNIIDQ